MSSSTTSDETKCCSSSTSSDRPKSARNRRSVSPWGWSTGPERRSRCPAAGPEREIHERLALLAGIALECEHVGDRVIVDGIRQTIGTQEDEVAVTEPEMFHLHAGFIARIANGIGENVLEIVSRPPTSAGPPVSLTRSATVWSFENCVRSPSRKRYARNARRARRRVCLPRCTRPSGKWPCRTGPGEPAIA